MRFLLSSLLIIAVFHSFSQTSIAGEIKDESGKGLPFATLYIEGTTIGTTTNGQGKYMLKVPSGKHTLVVQYLGYQKLRKPFSISQNESKSINLVLRPETIQLNAIIVNSDNEDPAYRVIREAMRMRKFHENEVNAFSCEVYIKGVQKLTDKPEKFLGVDIDIDTGIVYLSESISNFQFEQPDQVKEVMVSSKVSGSNNAFSWNQASDLMINLYQNKFEYEGLSERGFVSPIASNAFLFYEYEHLGVFYEDSLTINKIKVIPKRNTDPVFSGIIYIVEKSWRIHSTDLFLTKQRGIEFVDSINFQQVFAPLNNGIFMPLTQDFTFKFKILGFEGNGRFLSVYTNYEVEPNYDLYRQYNLFSKNIEDSTQKIDLFSEKDFNNTILKVNEDANKKDSLYWIDVRPIPLSEIEVKDYLKKDSIEKVKQSKPYKDSIDQKNNKLDVSDVFLTGYTYRNSFNGNYFSFPSLLEMLNFNTVEGFAPTGSISWTKRDTEYRNQTRFRVSSTIRYGVSNERLQAKFSFLKVLNSRRNSIFQIGFGRFISQFNAMDPISQFNNTYFTLFEGRNFMKIYEKNFFTLRYTNELFAGLDFSAELDFQNRDFLSNSNRYTFNEDNLSRLTSNTPKNIEVNDTFFEMHQALKLELGFFYQPGQRYIDRPDMRLSVGSKYPTFGLIYETAKPVSTTDIDYDQIRINIKDDIKAGLFGTFNYSLIGGAFLRNERMEFPDYRHFNGNLTYVGDFNINNFQTLPYYRFSTNERFLEAHAEHHFNEFILNKIPLIRKLNWQTLLAIHYLHTPAAGNYAEFGIGIEHIFKVLRVDYYRGYHNGDLSNVGIRVGAGF